ncbi:MAG TPA: alkaline phosphatase family protein [Candidatus Angelobacter sp.]|nr:alkaline phosphatase family protein [Candidatus Angelobacter sp.]
MLHVRRLFMLSAFALLIILGQSNASAEELKTVFVIAMENHNWTQPANQFTGGIQQIFQNPAAPFINSLVNGTAVAAINGRDVRISEQVALATNYHNVLATPSGNNPHIHPSEPNYLWAEAGANFGIFNDNDPFAAVGGTEQTTNQHLTTFLTNAGKTWRSYQEETDLATVTGQLTNVVLPRNQWTVPLKSASGVFAAGNFNQFNGSNQFNYAAKHNPMVFFTDSSGGNDTTAANPLSQQYAPLQQLFADLANNTVADYNFISPDQFNDMHTTLAGGYKGLTGDAAKILQGDDFLRQIIPVIMASKAYQENGVIIIWFDESEQDGVAGDNPDDFNHTLGEIVISQHAHKNVNGVPFASAVNLSHSSDLRTLEEIFHLSGPFLGDAANAADLSSLFEEGAIPHHDNDEARDHD